MDHSAHDLSLAVFNSRPIAGEPSQRFDRKVTLLRPIVESQKLALAEMSLTAAGEAEVVANATTETRKARMVMSRIVFDTNLRPILGNQVQGELK